MTGPMSSGLIRRTSGRLASTLAVFGIATVLLTPAASAEEKPLDLSIVAPSPIVVDLHRVAGVATEQANVNIVLLNNGTQASEPISFDLQLDDETDKCTHSEVSIEPANKGNVVVPSKDPLLTSLMISMPAACAGVQGTLLVDPRSSAPVTSRVSVVRDAVTTFLWIPVAVGFVVAGLFAVILLSTESRWAHRAQPIGTGPAWSFKDSWLTNITALGAVLGSILSATGVVDDLIPGIPAAHVLGMSLLFGFIVLSAPLVYAWSFNWEYDDETPAKLEATALEWGVVAATSVTLWAVVGQLGTILLLVILSPMTFWPKFGVSVLLVAGAALSIWHTKDFVQGVTERRPADPDKHLPTSGGRKKREVVAPNATISGVR